MAADSAQHIRDRAFRYAYDTGKIALEVNSHSGARPIADQLLKSGTGIGANLEEAKAASSKREQIARILAAIVLKAKG